MIRTNFHLLVVAQPVEQLTFNQWVQGSNPCALTKINRLVSIFYLPFYNVTFLQVFAYFDRLNKVSADRVIPANYGLAFRLRRWRLL